MYKRNVHQARRPCCGAISIILSLVFGSALAFMVFSLRHAGTIETLLRGDTGGVLSIRQNSNISHTGELSTPSPSLSYQEHTAEAAQKPDINNELHVNTPHVALAPSLPELVLLSADASVAASVRGNLGPPEVVLSPKVDNWLEDRWQTARNMQGDPISGVHFIRFALKALAARVTRVVLDFEAAFAKDYTIEVKCDGDKKWNLIHNNAEPQTDNIVTITTSKNVVNRISLQHIVHTIDISTSFELTSADGNSGKCYISELLVTIHRPATRWGTSLWRVEIWGYHA